MAVVAGVLLHHVDVDPTERALLAPAVAGVVEAVKGQLRRRHRMGLAGSVVETASTSGNISKTSVWTRRSSVLL
jgi:hypothetical protein